MIEYDVLIQLIIERLQHCRDQDLLDLIHKLLLQSGK